jgi:hypothetical protein
MDNGQNNCEAIYQRCDKSLGYLMLYKVIMYYLYNVSAFECFETN